MRFTETDFFIVLSPSLEVLEVHRSFSLQPCLLAFVAVVLHFNLVLSAWKCIALFYSNIMHHHSFALVVHKNCWTTKVAPTSCSVITCSRCCPLSPLQGKRSLLLSVLCPLPLLLCLALFCLTSVVVFILRCSLLTR